MRPGPSNWLVWFGVIGGAAAWALQFVANLAFTFAQCNNPGGRWQLPVHGWAIALSAAAIVVDLAAIAVCVRLFRGTYDLDHEVAGAERRGDGFAPPLGRINFLSMVGLTVNFLALAIIVMTSIGAPLLPVCQQS